jgi:23S rRNA (guanosine2251-2'-O)-methyltransferase
MKKVVLLDNVRSVLNVGSIFRTANGLGVDEIILCGITPSPLDKKGERRKDFAKVALGSEESLAWRSEEDALAAVKNYKELGYQIVALEQSEKSIDYKEVKVNTNVLFVVGSEVDGVSLEVLKEADTVIEIPMMGLKESLNVTIAFGVAGYRLFDRKEEL